MIATKLMMLPSVISYNSLNDAWIVFLGALALDFVVMIGIVALMQKSSETIFDLISRKIGKIVATAIFVILGVFFVFKILDLMFQSFVMLNEKIYIGLDKTNLIIIVSIVVIYFGTREFRSLGRTIEILFTTVCAVLVLSFVISRSGTDATNILPFFGTGMQRISQNLFQHLFWFGDSLIMLFFVGNVKKEKGMSKKLILSYLGSIAVVILFVITFTSVFANTASMHRCCVLDICEILPRLLTEGRFNWIVDFVFPLIPVFAIAIYSYLACNCFAKPIAEFTPHKKLVSVGTVVILMFIFLYMFQATWESFYIFSSSILPYASIVFQILFPIILLVMGFVDKKKEGETT